MPSPSPSPSNTAQAYTEPQPLELSRILKLNSELVYSDIFFKVLSFVMLMTTITLPYVYAPQIIELFDYYLPNDNAKPVLGAFVVNMVTYTIGNLIYMVVYKMNHKFFEQYKCTKTPWPWQQNYKRWRKQLRRTFKVLFLNFFVITPPLMYFMINYLPMGSSTSVAGLPSFPVFLLQLSFMTVCEDFFFYWSHRTIHTPYLYKKIHYMHHEYKQNVAICSVFAHPIEYTLGNVWPTFAGATLMAGHCHYITFLVFVMIRIIETQEGHCGYEFPWAICKFLPFNTTTDYHDFHHHTNKGNFGAFFIFWDTVFSTNRWYYSYLEKRNKLEKKQE